MNIWSAVIVFVLAFFVELAEHYFPWHRLLGGRPLRAPVTYILGLGALLLVFGGWCAMHPFAPAWEAFVILLAAVAGGGTAVIGGYLFDGHHDTRDDLTARDLYLERLEDELARVRSLGGDA